MSKAFNLKLKSFVTSDKVKINYLITPTGESTHTILFIHGLGHDGKIWKYIQEKLFAEGYSSLAIDLRGHGLSDNPVAIENYRFERISKDITELISELKISSTILVGHSLGGMIAMYLAGTKPSLLTGLVLMETNYQLSLPLLPKDVNQKLSKVFASLAYLFPNEQPREHDDYDNYENTGDWDLRRIASDISGTSLRNYLIACSKVASFEAKGLLSSIEVPTLVIAGEKDTIAPPVQAVDLVKQIRGAKYIVIANANHLVTLNDPANLSKIITEFVNSFK
jgi:3-oxoadipate enol-lactonase